MICLLHKVSTRRGEITRQAIPESTILGLKRSGVRICVRLRKVNMYYRIEMCRKEDGLLPYIYIYILYPKTKAGRVQQ